MMCLFCPVSSFVHYTCNFYLLRESIYKLLGSKISWADPDPIGSSSHL